MLLQITSRRPTAPAGWKSSNWTIALKAAKGLGAIRIGVHRTGSAPGDNLDDFDLLLSTDPNAGMPLGLDPLPKPWAVSSPRSRRRRWRVAPNAATVLTQILRMTLELSFDDALILESLGYSALLGGLEFRAWRARTPIHPRSRDNEERVRLTRAGDLVHVTLARGRRRATRLTRGCAMRCSRRSSLVCWIPTSRPSSSRGKAPHSPSGGDLTEFGAATDLAGAHIIRIERSTARLIHQIRERVTSRLHGPCIGAGIEIPAAAGRVTGGAPRLVPAAGGFHGPHPWRWWHGHDSTTYRAPADVLHGLERVAESTPRQRLVGV